MKKVIKHKHNILIISVSFLIVFGAVYAMKSHFFVKNDIHDYAAIVLKTCEDSAYKRGCFDEEIPKLMDYISMEEAFEVTKIVQESNTEYLYCHVLGHNLSAIEISKDPMKWKEVVTRCPSGVCVNGCIHGAFQERFRTESMSDNEIDSIIPELKTVCENSDTWSPTGMEKATCYHAIGHLIMFVTEGDIYKSTAVCEEVGKDIDPAYSRLCFDGSFMQVFQAEGPEDIDLVKDIAPQTGEEAENFCSNFTGLKNSSCHHLSWPLYRNDVFTPQGLENFCTYTEDASINTRCYHVLFYKVADYLQEVPKITEFCSSLPDSVRVLCFVNTAARMLEIDYSLGDSAASLCENADTHGGMERCYDYLVVQSTFSYHPGSSEAHALCQVLPEPWKTECQKRQ